MIKRIGIVGIGAWASAIAILLAENGLSVTVWSQEIDLIEEISTERENKKYLKGVQFPRKVSFTTDENQLALCDLIIQAIPTQFIRQVFNRIGIPIAFKPILNVAKGIEKGTLKRVSEILKDFDVGDEDYAILTGPSHAEEVVKRVPTAVVVASKNAKLREEVQKLFTNVYFRVYTSDDVIGCELGGSLKNVIAIAAGIIDGLELGDNSKAALITRGLAEITRLGTAMGADPLTFAGLSGLGDLIVTCNSKYSRNRFVGEQIAKGRKLEEIVKSMNAVAEGVDTTISAYQLSLKQKVELPITKKVYEILFENLEPRNAILELMTREAKPEVWR
ncbi:NAD(P)-dependent glycerol-3-phosphate dehydrogenase [Bacteroidetes/Chlorobi group bacterium Naka2016]|jgi:glycerol-3-phosphate dehydrogenase (NAD(P)+)|nr:MAG: NAD(P)-dependent glycerol-3-phosphate dehydrogenase [Bacteroidetes/Chlorobi group bacterium Naka2016]